MAQVIGPLPLHWESRMEFLAAGFSVASCCGRLGSDPAMGDLCVCVSVCVCVSFKSKS